MEIRTLKKMALSGLLLILVVGMTLAAGIPAVSVEALVDSKGGLSAKWTGGPGPPPWAGGEEEEGAAGAATGVVSPPPESAVHRWALIIGIADYRGTENDLKYTDDDAKDLNKTLVEKYGYWVNHTTVLLDNMATKSGILAAIALLRENEKMGDEVVFYYSRHGVRGVKWDSDKEAIDEGIVPYDFDGTGYSVIWDGDLAVEFSKFETTRFFMGFDTCYAGGFDDLVDSGRVICMSSSEKQLSYESDVWQNGEFTYYFVDQGMYKGLADTTGPEGKPDGFVTVEEAFDYAKANCQYDDPAINDLFPDDMLL